jgi:hypothetical protein
MDGESPARPLVAEELSGLDRPLLRVAGSAVLLSVLGVDQILNRDAMLPRKGFAGHPLALGGLPALTQAAVPFRVDSRVRPAARTLLRRGFASRSYSSAASVRFVFDFTSKRFRRFQNGQRGK